MANHYQQLNGLQRQWVKLYTGRSKIAGNATQCYKAVYGLTNERSAQVGGSRLLANPNVQAILAQAEARAMEQLSIDAKFVLAESLRLYQRAMGDDAYDHVTVETDPETGEERVSVREQRSYDPATAHKALQAIGQHKDVQAFTVTVEHNHTHHLEQRLAARSKVIEGRAAQVLGDDRALADAGPVDPHAVAHVEGGGGVASSEVGAHAVKRVHPAEVKDDRTHEQEKTTSERAGATAE